MFTRAIKGATLDQCDFSVHFGTLELAEIFTYYERLRTYVQHEDGLINSRLTWSLTIHGFLFAIYGILAGKTVDILMSRNPLVGAVSGLLTVQITVALVGEVVGYYSREAIVAAHNSLQHLLTIAHVNGVLQIPAMATTSPGAIADGFQAVTPVSMSGITAGARLLVGSEIVTAVEADHHLFRATFANAHVADTRITPLGLVLPKIISGGASDQHTRGANLYYVWLPVVMMGAWVLLAGFSASVLWVVRYRPLLVFR